MKSLKHYQKVISIVLLACFFLFPAGCSVKNKTQKKPVQYQTLIKSYDEDKEYKHNMANLKDNMSFGGKNLPAVQNQNISMLKESLKNTGKLQGIPILTYHCIDNTIFGVKEMFISPASFDEQMKYIRDQGFTPITFQDLNRIDTIQKPIMITLDDGYEDNYLFAYPILKKYNIKATIFLIANAINKQKYLSLSQINQMKDLIDFQSHTISHPHLAALSMDKISYELSESQKRLEALLKKKINVIAYPYGSYNSTVVNIAKKYYTYGVTTHFGRFYDNLSSDLQINRMSVQDNTNFPTFEQFFK